MKRVQDLKNYELRIIWNSIRIPKEHKTKWSDNISYIHDLISILPMQIPILPGDAEANAKQYKDRLYNWEIHAVFFGVWLTHPEAFFLNF